MAFLVLKVLGTYQGIFNQAWTPVVLQTYICTQISSYFFWLFSARYLGDLHLEWAAKQWVKERNNFIYLTVAASLKCLSFLNPCSWNPSHHQQKNCDLVFFLPSDTSTFFFNSIYLHCDWGNASIDTARVQAWGFILI